MQHNVHTHNAYYFFGTEPVITQFPDEDKEVVEGEEVVFRVKVTGDPVPKLTWYLNGEKLMVDFSKELAADGTLTIPSAEIKHGGVYKLMAVNRVGRMEKEVNLSVKLDGQLVSRVPIEEFSDYVSKCHTEDNKDFNSQFKVVRAPNGYIVYLHVHYCRRWKIKMITTLQLMASVVALRS